jgi:adenylate cyclase
MVKPFGSCPILEQACPMTDILSELQAQLKELALYKEDASSQMISA